MSNQPPPISLWGHVWRTALVLAISAASWLSIAEYQGTHAPWWFWADLALGILALGLSFGRRRFPVTIAIVTNVLTAVSASAGGPATLALFSLATRRRWGEIVPSALVALVAATVFLMEDPQSDELPLAVNLGFLVTIIAVTVGWGMYVGSRRELLATLRERAETAEAEQSARVAGARTAERARIAREMHDVLAHRISMVAMHAGALDFRDDLAADEVKRTAQIIRESSHQALVELRQVLGVLRDDPGDAAPEPPQPSAQHVPALVEGFRAAGMNLEVDGFELCPDVPDAVGRTVYRVVQEGLTNAAKHAPGTLVTVSLVGSADDGVLVQVTNRLPIGSSSHLPRVSGPGLPESGLGLVGLAERAELAGGRLTRLRDDTTFTLRVWLPWPA